MVKDFNKSRVSVINVYNSFKEGVQQTLDICKTTHISLGSPEGKKMLFYFCFQKINKDSSLAKTKYPKVLYVAEEQIDDKFSYFLHNHMSKIIKKCPFPYCGIYNSKSPDLEHAACQSVSTLKTKNSSKLSISNFFKRLGVKTSYTANNEPSFSPKH